MGGKRITFSYLSSQTKLREHQRSQYLSYTILRTHVNFFVAFIPNLLTSCQKVNESVGPLPRRRPRRRPPRLLRRRQLFLHPLQKLLRLKRENRQRNRLQILKVWE